MEVFAWFLSPEHFPYPHRVRKLEFSLEPDEEPPKAEIQVAALLGVQVIVEHRVYVVENFSQIVKLALYSS